MNGGKCFYKLFSLLLKDLSSNEALCHLQYSQNVSKIQLWVLNKKQCLTNHSRAAVYWPLSWFVMLHLLKHLFIHRCQFPNQVPFRP